MTPPKTTSQIAEELARYGVDTSGSVNPIDIQARRLLERLPLEALLNVARAAMEDCHKTQRMINALYQLPPSLREDLFK